MSTKKCSKCGQVKPYEAFPVAKRMKSGRHSWCSECHARRMKEKYTTSADHREKQKQYSRSEKAVAARREHNSRPEVKDKAKARNPERNRRMMADPVARAKHYARCAVRRAVQKGILVNPKSCQAGNKYGVTEHIGDITAHHHNGYDRNHWLDVEWLCQECHRLADIQTRDSK